MKYFLFSYRSMESIDALEDLGCWSQLNAISKHALESAIACTDGSLPNLLKSLKVRLAIFEMGFNEFKEVFKEEFLEKMSWDK